MSKHLSSTSSEALTPSLKVDATNKPNVKRKAIRVVCEGCGEDALVAFDIEELLYCDSCNVSNLAPPENNAGEDYTPCDLVSWE